MEPAAEGAETGRRRQAARRVSKSADAFRTISEVSEELGVPQHVLRFWETRFAELRPLKRGGNRRYYRPADVALAAALKRLLYEEGYTVRGVQRLLAEHGVRSIAAGAPGSSAGGRGSPAAAPTRGLPAPAVAEEVAAALPGWAAERLARVRARLAAALSPAE